MATKSYHPSAIVDNTPDAPAFPDVDHLGKSRIGRKLRRKALDRYHVALRRYEGRPAKSGPPIPNSEKHGHRVFYSVEQCRRGWLRSLQVRRANAQPKHDHCRRLRFAGRLLREISVIVGYSIAHISKIVRGKIRRPSADPSPVAAVAGGDNANASARPKRAARAIVQAALYHGQAFRGWVEATDVRERLRYERLMNRLEWRIIRYDLKLQEVAPADLSTIRRDSRALTFRFKGQPIAAGIQGVNMECRK